MGTLDGKAETADRPAELLPDLDVFHRHVERSLRAAELLGGQRDGGSWLNSSRASFLRN